MNFQDYFLINFLNKNIQVFYEENQDRPCKGRKDPA